MEENKVLNEQEIEAKERELLTTRRGISIAMEHEDIQFLLEEAQRQNMQLHNFFNYGDVIHQLIEYYKLTEQVINGTVSQYVFREEEKKDAE